MDVEEGRAYISAPSSRPCFVGGGMTRFSVFRSLAVALGAISTVAACGGGGGRAHEQLAADQTLSFPIGADVGDLHPAHTSAALGIAIFRTVHPRHHRLLDQFDDEPDIATRTP